MAWPFHGVRLLALYRDSHMVRTMLLLINTAAVNERWVSSNILQVKDPQMVIISEQCYVGFDIRIIGWPCISPKWFCVTRNGSHSSFYLTCDIQIQQTWKLEKPWKY